MTPLRRNTVVAFLVLFGVVGSQCALETARDALFLASLPATRLPWAYLLTAAGVSVAAWLVRPLPGRRHTAGVLALVGGWMLVVRAVAPSPYVVYASVGVGTTLMLVQTWTLIGAQFNIVEARRTFGIIAAGGALGSVAAGLIATRIVATHGPLALLAGAGVTLAASGVGALGLRGPSARPRDEEEAPLGRMVRTAYARRVFWMIALGTIATTIGDFVYKSAVATSVPPSGLASFFARYQLVMSAVGLAMQLVVAPLLLRRVGANRTVLALPLALAGAGVGFALVPGLAAGVALKALDNGLRNSVHRTSTEVLYLPLPVAIRGRVKAIVDGIGQRSAQAVAALFVLGALFVGARPAQLALAVTISAVACVIVTIGVRRHYIQTFSDRLSAGGLHADALPELDLQSVESLLAMLNSPEDARVVAALDTLAAQGKVKLIPSLLLYHPSPEVAARALEILAASPRRDFLPLTERLLSSTEPALVAEVARVRADLVGEPGELRRLASDVRPSVRVAGLAGLVRIGAATDVERAQLERLAAGDPAAQIARLRALQAAGDPGSLRLALLLLGDRGTREAARAVLVETDARGLELLAHALGDPGVALEVRRHIPRTLSRFGNERAAAILLGGLEHADLDAVTRHKMLRGLGRMKRDNPSLRLDREAVRRLARRAVTRTRELRRWRGVLARVSATPANALLKALVARKERMAVERLFRALDLLRPGGEMERIHDGLRSPDTTRRATSRELLEHVVDPALRSEVLALVDSAPIAEPTLEDAVAEMQRDHSSAVRALVAEYLAESEIVEVRHAG
jgi:ATP:ADP antiporter, AAA family